MTPAFFILLVLLGIGIGFLASLFGIGGGFLLVPTMITIVGLDEHMTVGTVAFVILGLGISSTVAYARQKRIDFLVSSIMAAASIGGAIIGALTTEEVSGTFILVGFGVTESILALILGLKKTPQEKLDKSSAHMNAEEKIKEERDLVISKSKDKWYVLHRIHYDKEGNKYEYASNLLISFPLSFLAGFLSSLLGIGGGTLYIQIFVFLCGMSIHMAIAGSIFTIFVSHISSTITFAQMGQIDWLVGLAYLIGMVIGAQLGALVSKKIHSKHLKPMAALMILIIAIRMIIFALIEN